LWTLGLSSSRSRSYGIVCPFLNLVGTPFNGLSIATNCNVLYAKDCQSGGSKKAKLTWDDREEQKEDENNAAVVGTSQAQEDASVEIQSTGQDMGESKVSLNL
jgi:hypothetical protein